MNRPEQVIRNEQGRWNQGVSGNPAGRPPNSEAIRRLLEPHAPALVQKAIDMALEGDSGALRLCLDRLAPASRPESLPVDVPEIVSAEGWSGKAKAVIEAAAQGRISTDAAERLLGALASAAKVVEMEDFERRIRVLESSLEAKA